MTGAAPQLRLHASLNWTKVRSCANKHGREAAAHGRCWFTSMTMDEGASNGANGGYCAHPCALVAVEPRLHHDQLTAYHLAVVQHGAVLQLALEQHGSCRHEGCFTLLICSLLLGYLNWGRGSQGRIRGVRHFAGVAVVPYKTAASISTLQPQARHRAVVSWSAAVLCCPHDDLFLDMIEVMS